MATLVKDLFRAKDAPDIRAKSDKAAARRENSLGKSFPLRHQGKGKFVKGSY